MLLCLHVDRYAGRLPLLAASDSRPGNDQQTAVTWGQKSLLTRPCLTLLTQAISSFYHARLSGFSLHPLATHVLTWAHINEDTFISGSTWRFVLLYLAFNRNSLSTHLFNTLGFFYFYFLFTLLPFTLSMMKEMTLSVMPRFLSTGCIVVSAEK